MAAEGPGFKSEVAHFKAVLGRVQAHCEAENSAHTAPLHVPASQWSPEFQVTSQDCHLMGRRELDFLDDLMVDALQRYKASIIKANAT